MARDLMRILRCSVRLVGVLLLAGAVACAAEAETDRLGNLHFDFAASNIPPERIRTAPGVLAADGAGALVIERDAGREDAFAGDWFVVVEKRAGAAPVRHFRFRAAYGDFAACVVRLSEDRRAVVLERKTTRGTPHRERALALHRIPADGTGLRFRARVAGVASRPDGTPGAWARRYRLGRNRAGALVIRLLPAAWEPHLRPAAEADLLVTRLGAVVYAYAPDADAFRLVEVKVRAPSRSSPPAGDASEDAEGAASGAPTRPADGAADRFAPLRRLMLEELETYRRAGRHEAGLLQAEHFREMIAKLPERSTAALRFRDGALFHYEGIFLAGLGKIEAARRSWRIAVLNGTGDYSDRASERLRADEADGAEEADGASDAATDPGAGADPAGEGGAE